MPDSDRIMINLFHHGTIFNNFNEPDYDHVDNVAWAYNILLRVRQAVFI